MAWFYSSLDCPSYIVAGRFADLIVEGLSGAKDSWDSDWIGSSYPRWLKTGMTSKLSSLAVFIGIPRDYQSCWEMGQGPSASKLVLIKARFGQCWVLFASVSVKALRNHVFGKYPCLYRKLQKYDTDLSGFRDTLGIMLSWSCIHNCHLD